MHLDFSAHGKTDETLPCLRRSSTLSVLLSLSSDARLDETSTYEEKIAFMDSKMRGKEGCILIDIVDVGTQLYAWRRIKEMSGEANQTQRRMKGGHCGGLY
jgi:hypothetical protein